MICCVINCIIFSEFGKSSCGLNTAVFLSWMKQEVLKETLAALVLLRADMLRLAWSSSESTKRVKTHFNLGQGNPIQKCKETTTKK